MNRDRDNTRLTVVLAVLVVVMIVAFVVTAATIPFMRFPSHVEKTVEERLEVTPKEVLARLNELGEDVSEVRAEQARVREALNNLQGNKAGTNGAPTNQDSPK